MGAHRDEPDRGDGALSITAAARDAADSPAIITATRALSFADCAQLISTHRPPAEVGPRPPASLVASPTIETVLAAYAALERRHPIAMLHAKQVPDERERQRELVARAHVPDGTAFVLFTSGSTNAPRGVVVSRDAIEAAAHASAAHLGWRDDDRWLCCLPLAHAGGLSIVVRCAIARKPVVLLEGDFDADRAAALIAEQRPTLASFVPTQLAALLDRGVAPGALRAVLLGGAAAAPTLVSRAVAAGWPVLPTYGLTETFGQIATAREPGGELVILPGVTITTAGASATARESGGELAMLPGVAIDATATGTLRVRGPMLATAYLDGTPIAPELVTADLGTVEGDIVRIAGRRDDVIITGGENVHPAEVEAVLAATPGVRSACVFGVPDARWGSVVAAAIAIDARFDPREALVRWHEALTAHARPRRLATLDALPVLATGKLDRRAIATLPTTAIDYR